MNRKGFTLIELIVTIMLLALIMSITAYSIINVIRSSKEENYRIFVKNVSEAAELYYQDCKYAGTISSDKCVIDGDGYKISLQNLVDYGYLTGNGKDNDGKYKAVDPVDKKDIGGCLILVSYSDGKVVVSKGDSNQNCPDSYEVKYSSNGGGQNTASSSSRSASSSSRHNLSGASLPSLNSTIASSIPSTSIGGAGKSSRDLGGIGIIDDPRTPTATE